MVELNRTRHLNFARAGIKLAKEKGVGLILAVGGGSAIDSAKAIALGAKYDGDVWDFAEEKAVAKEALPVGVILTIPAAGSESSQYSVLTNEDGPYPLKRDVIVENNQLIRPQFAILNPVLTFTLPPFQTACGVSDILAHVMERYFTNVKDVELTDRLCEATMKTVINNGLIVMKEPENYSARAEVMWAGSIAHNDLLGTGRAGDFASHMIEHELSGLYDIAHGAGLSIIFPAWMKYMYKYNLPRFAQFAARVWNVDDNFFTMESMALEAIKRQTNFYKAVFDPRYRVDGEPHALCDRARLEESGTRRRVQRARTDCASSYLPRRRPMRRASERFGFRSCPMFGNRIILSRSPRKRE